MLLVPITLFIYFYYQSYKYNSFNCEGNVKNFNLSADLIFKLFEHFAEHYKNKQYFFICSKIIIKFFII